MNDLLKQLISYLGSFTVLVAALAYLFKTLFKQLLDRDLDKYKHELTLERERLASERSRDLEAFKGQLLQSLETYKAQLQIANKEQEIRFVKLHEKRAGILIRLYGELEDLGQKANIVTAFITREGMVDEAEQQLRDVLHLGSNLERYFKENKLYFSKELATLMEGLITKLSSPSDTRLRQAIASDPKSYGQSVRHGVMGWRSEFMPIQEEALRKIEQEFRIMLGSEQQGET